MPAKETVELAGAAMGVVRSALLVGLVLALLIQPSLFRSTLDRLGIDEFEVFGAKVKTALNQVANRLEEAESAKGKLEVQLKQTADALTQVSQERDAANARLAAAGTPARAPDPATTAALNALQAQNAAALAQADTARTQAQRTLATNAVAITAARRAEVPAGRFLIVYSSDATLPAAQDTAKAAVAKGFNNGRIYFHNNYFASTLEFATRAEADAALPQARAFNRYARDAYIRPVDAWCPGAVERPDGVIECGS